MSEKGPLPEEISRFYVSKESFREILGEFLGGNVDEIEINDGEITINMPINFIEGITAEEYKRNVNSIRSKENGDIEIILRQKVEEKTEDESEQNEDSQEKEESEAENDEENGEEPQEESPSETNEES